MRSCEYIVCVSNFFILSFSRWCMKHGCPYLSIICLLYKLVHYSHEIKLKFYFVGPCSCYIVTLHSTSLMLCTLSELNKDKVGHKTIIMCHIMCNPSLCTQCKIGRSSVALCVLQCV